MSLGGLAPLQFAKVLAAVYFLMNLAIVIFMGLITQVRCHPQPFCRLVSAHVRFYLGFGFILSLIAA